MIEDDSSSSEDLFAKAKKKETEVLEQVSSPSPQYLKYQRSQALLHLKQTLQTSLFDTPPTSLTP